MHGQRKESLVHMFAHAQFPQDFWEFEISIEFAPLH